MAEDKSAPTSPHDRGVAAFGFRGALGACERPSSWCTYGGAELWGRRPRGAVPQNQPAGVAKLADAPDLGSGTARYRGSSPLPGTPPLASALEDHAVGSTLGSGTRCLVFICIRRPP